VTDLYLTIGALFLFLVLDLLAIAARAAFTQLSHGRLLTMREPVGEKILSTLSLLTKLPRIKASLNLSILFCHVLLAGFVLIITVGPPLSLTWIISLVILLAIALLIFFSEWLVEKIISNSPEIWSIRLTAYVRVTMIICSIFLIPLVFTKKPHSATEMPSLVTEDELKTLVDAGQEEGVLEQGERRMIYSIFQLGDTLAREIMVPRIDLQVLDVNTPLVEAVDSLLRSGHSRVPVYEDTVDHLIGLLYAKDLLSVWREEKRPESIRDLMRPAYFVPEAKKVDELLAEMQKQRVHMAIIVDEYGGVAGMLTLEDIVEEIVGEIQDEYDQGEEAPYQKLADGSYLFQGHIDLDSFNEMMGSYLPSDEADTLGGYIYSQLGRTPVVGEKLLSENLLLTVEQVSARRIRKIRAGWQAAAANSGEDIEHVDG